MQCLKSFKEKVHIPAALKWKGFVQMLKIKQTVALKFPQKCFWLSAPLEATSGPQTSSLTLPELFIKSCSSLPQEGTLLSFSS